MAALPAYRSKCKRRSNTRNLWKNSSTSQKCKPCSMPKNGSLHTFAENVCAVLLVHFCSLTLSMGLTAKDVRLLSQIFSMVEE